MKLLIDIPEEIVTAIQNGEDYRYDIHTTIAQEIPYESNGDLISRETLKQMLPAPIEDEYKRVYQIIDNAPTVEIPTELCKGCRFLKDCETCEEKLRPQGKYVDISKLRLMTVEECAGHTIEYAMGWKACIEWIKGGVE